MDDNLYYTYSIQRKVKHGHIFFTGIQMAAFGKKKTTHGASGNFYEANPQM